MAVIIHPAHRAVLADDPVFGVIHLFLAVPDLLIDGRRDLFVIQRMEHAPEGVAGEPFEILQIVAAENVEHSFVGVQQFLRLLGAVDKKSPGHMLSDLPNDGNVLFVQLKIFFRHSVPPSFRFAGIFPDHRRGGNLRLKTAVYTAPQSTVCNH